MKRERLQGLQEMVNWDSLNRPARAQQPSLGQAEESAGSEEIEEPVLKVIEVKTEERCGIGRMAIIYALRQHGIHINDHKAKRLLENLEEGGLITVGKGRIGCRITSRRRACLKENFRGA